MHVKKGGLNIKIKKLGDVGGGSKTHGRSLYRGTMVGHSLHVNKSSLHPLHLP